MFAFEPFFDFASQKARQTIVERGDAIGVGWQERVDGMKRNMDALRVEYDSLFDEKARATVISVLSTPSPSLRSPTFLLYATKSDSKPYAGDLGFTGTPRRRTARTLLRPELFHTKGDEVLCDLALLSRGHQSSAVQKTRCSKASNERCRRKAPRLLSTSPRLIPP